MIAESVCIVQLADIWPEMPKGGDVADMLDSDGPWSCLDGEDIRERLGALAADAPEWTPTADDAQPKAGKSRIGEPVFTCAADIKPERLQYLWPGRFLLGKLNALGAEGGTGKGLTWCDMAGRLTTGRPWPDAPDRYFAPRGVVIANGEDGRADTIVPRLIQAGADLTRVNILHGVTTRGADGAPVDGSLTLFDIPAIGQTIDATPNAGLVIVDPVGSFLPRDINSHNDAEIRSILTPLSELAERKRVAILLVVHLGKDESRSAANRVLGSVGLMNACRVGWLLVRSPDDPTGLRRLLMPMKSNLSNDRAGLAFSIVPPVDGSDHPRVEWEPDPVSGTADDALAAIRAASREPTATDRATEWLGTRLSDGPRMGKELLAEAGEAGGPGFKEHIVYAAAERLGVEKNKTSMTGGWLWTLPDRGPR